MGSDVGQRLLEYYPDFIAAEPQRLRHTYPALSLAACEDIAQEAFLRVGSRAAAGGLAADTNVVAYLRRAARNLAVDRTRDQQRAGRRLVLMGGDSLAAVPEQRAFAEEESRLVLEDLVLPAIERMPEDLRRQVVDLQSRGLSDPEIVARLGIPAVRLHNLRNKAVAHLRRTLAGHIREGHRKKKQQHGKKDR
ncbi:RNA polymerase sigma factor [Streptomyces sp. NPDC048595]|uniref:RNA polymerase sigma factor n=1 Tax=Streptomyces sp. NPDC048595 TaxID=3365576 RepID=UPI00371D1D71